MSLARLALRLATYEAMVPSSSLPDGPWPTLAAKNAFLSRLDPIDDLSPQERRPVAIIYTEDESGEPGQLAGGPPFDLTVDLMVDLSIVAQVTDDGDTYGVGSPYLDDELETSLDVFEAQVVFVLMFGPTGKLWRDLTGRKVISTHSTIKRGSEEGARLAIRTLHIKVKVPDDTYNPTPTGTETGTALLPEPLQTVANAIDTDSYGGKIIAGILAGVPRMSALPQFGGATMTFQPGSPPADADVTKRQIVASAPDPLPTP